MPLLAVGVTLTVITGMKIQASGITVAKLFMSHLAANV